MTVKELEEVLNKSELEKKSKLILYNDDVNTFDHVIDCLQTYCGHSLIQAEQCATIVHCKGKCCVKEGSKLDMKILSEMLNLNKLNSEVEHG